MEHVSTVARKDIGKYFVVRRSRRWRLNDEQHVEIDVGSIFVLICYDVYDAHNVYTGDENAIFISSLGIVKAMVNKGTSFVDDKSWSNYLTVIDDKQ